MCNLYLTPFVIFRIKIIVPNFIHSGAELNGLNVNAYSNDAQN